MPVLIRKHGTTKDAAIARIQAAIRDAGYDRAVTWTGDHAEVRYGPFASLVHGKGLVTAESVILESCRGLASGPVLRVCRTVMNELFPDGERRDRPPIIDSDA
jgi:hypothetical protein